MNFFWDANVARYRDAQGRFVAAETIQQALAAAFESAKAEAQMLADRAVSGTLSLTMFEAQMRALLKDVHLYAAAVGAGGFQQLDAEAYGRIGRELRDQYTYLSALMGEIEAGVLALGNQFIYRAGLYPLSAKGTLSDATLAADRAAGMTEERNIEGFAEHCDECAELTRLGWVEIGTLPPIGRRTCLGNCKCRIVRR